MTREQKNALAGMVMDQVGNILEFWGERVEDEAPILRDLDYEEVRATLAAWMRKLPGTVWDSRLGPG